MNSSLDIKKIHQWLPHRYPMLLIDKVIFLKKGERTLTAIKNVTINEPFFNGHFPNRPVMPGVLIIEALAQAAGILTKLIESAYNPDLLKKLDQRLHYLASIDQAQFKRIVIPGDVLKLDVTLLKNRLDFCKFNGIASVDGESVCISKFMIVSRQNKDM